MTRKASTRGRKAGAARAAKSASRAATRTGKKTASARATKPAARVTVERKRPATRGAARQAFKAPAGDELRRDQVPAVHAEEDEDLDWLNEDEDPRSQIVEDEEDDWSPQHDDEW
jgi:hypothetical protein